MFVKDYPKLELKQMTTQIIKHALILIIVLKSTLLSFGQHSVNTDWISDLEYLKTTLPLHHADLFYQYPKESFENDIEYLKTKIHTYTDEQMFFGIQKILVKIGDSHTTSSILVRLPQISLPIYAYPYDDGLFVTSVLDADKDILGQKLTAINDFPIQTIIDSLKLLYVAENESWHKRRLPQHLNNYSILKYFGFVDDKKITITTEDYYGTEKKFKIKATETLDNEESDYDFIRFSSKKLRRPNTREIFGNKYIPQDSMLFVMYNKCTGREQQQLAMIADSMSIENSVNDHCAKRNRITPKDPKKQKPVPVLPYFRHFRDSVFNYITNNQVKTLVIDLSKNAGGATSQGSAMMEHLSKIIDVKKTKVYVIVSRRTFSAGLIHAMEAKRMLQATIIGEPTGGKPQFFGGTSELYLPTSCLGISYSRAKRKTSNDDEILEANTLTPDVVFPVKFSDVMFGTDLVYEWILAQKKKESNIRP